MAKLQTALATTRLLYVYASWRWLQVAELQSALADAQRKHEAARRLYEAEAQVTTQSAELLRRSEAEVSRLRRQASEHTARVEKAQLRMQDMREQLGSAQVGGWGGGFWVWCRHARPQGKGSTGLLASAGTARGAGGEGTGCRALGRVQGRAGLLGADGRARGRGCRNLQCRHVGRGRMLAGHGSHMHPAACGTAPPLQCQRAGKAEHGLTLASHWPQVVLLCCAVRCPVGGVQRFVRSAALYLADRGEGQALQQGTTSAHSRRLAVQQPQTGDATASLSLRRQLCTG